MAGPICFSTPPSFWHLIIGVCAKQLTMFVVSLHQRLLLRSLARLFVCWLLPCLPVFHPRLSCCRLLLLLYYSQFKPTKKFIKKNHFKNRVVDFGTGNRPMKIKRVQKWHRKSTNEKIKRVRNRPIRCRAAEAKRKKCQETSENPRERTVHRQRERERERALHVNHAQQHNDVH
jgi:hypothetical protein